MSDIHQKEMWNSFAEQIEPWAAGMWRSESSQVNRFHAILRRLPLESGDTLLDWGCGTARLSEFLPAGVVYHGVDPSPKMVERAKHDHSGCDISVLPQVESLDEYDHVVAIGCWNLAPWTQEMTIQMIEALYARARKSFVATLSNKLDEIHCYHDEDHIRDVVKSLTKDSQVKQRGSELLVVMRKCL